MMGLEVNSKVGSEQGNVRTQPQNKEAEVAGKLAQP